jgi:ubiquinone biosynthesis monooxygenase Coq7
MTEPCHRKLDEGLPGDPRPEEAIARMIRVDHAGEYGAVRIYEGQLAVLGRHPEGETIRRMVDEERKHLAAFDDLVNARRVRPTALAPLWHLGGFALGAATALLGAKAAMACTVAVEDVIDRHYADQAARLGDDEAALKETINNFRDDEIHHRDEGLAHGANEAPFAPILIPAVKAASRLAIWLSSRI